MRDIITQAKKCYCPYCLRELGFKAVWPLWFIIFVAHNGVIDYIKFIGKYIRGN